MDLDIDLVCDNIVLGLAQIGRDKRRDIEGEQRVDDRWAYGSRDLVFLLDIRFCKVNTEFHTHLRKT